MADMDAETSEHNQRNDRFVSLTENDLDKLLLEKDEANTLKENVCRHYVVFWTKRKEDPSSVEYFRLCRH